MRTFSSISFRHIKCHPGGMFKMENTQYETQPAKLKVSGIIVISSIEFDKIGSFRKHLN